MMSSALAMKQKIEPQIEEVPTAVRMADAIIERLEQSPFCSVEDLKAKGFTQYELGRYWGAAWKIVETKRPRPQPC